MASEEAAPQYVEDFFQHCFGFNEKKLLYPEVQQRFGSEDGGATLVSKENGRRHVAGSFAMPSLGSLREQARQAAKAEEFASVKPDPSAPPLTVRHVVTLDAMRDHADPQYRGSLFQVASQFNCLEFTSMKRTPEDGVAGYAHDQTQGPACAIACAPATVFRNYLVPVPRGAGQEPQIGQTAELQLNSLDQIEALLGNREAGGRGLILKAFREADGPGLGTIARARLLDVLAQAAPEISGDRLAAFLEEAATAGISAEDGAVPYERFVDWLYQAEPESKGRFFFIENGYICSDSEKLGLLKAKLEEMGEAGREDLRAALCVGFAQGSEVVFKALVPFEGLEPMPTPASAAERQEVSQVFCAAAKVNTSFATRTEWEPFARLLLEATYEASLWAGVMNMCGARKKAAVEGKPPPAGCHRVLWTQVGGGVFGNELEWIVDAMNRALAHVAAEAPPGGWGLEVCLTHFRELNDALEEAVGLGAYGRAPA